MNATLLKLLAAVSALFYAATFLLSIKKSKNRKLLAVLWALGYAANLSLVLNNYFVNGYVPFVSMYQVLTFLAACFLPIYAYMRTFRGGRRTEAAFSAIPSVIMVGLVFMDAKSKWSFPPALQSPWFVPHVLVYMIAYTMAALAFVFAVCALAVRKEEQKELFLRDTYDAVCVSYPFMTMGMFFGAIWANEVWGHFWSWDIKEIWALMTWLFYTLYLHFHHDGKLRRFESPLAILGFVGVIVTFFFVNIFSSGVHSYA